MLLFLIVLLEIGNCWCTSHILSRVRTIIQILDFPSHFIALVFNVFMDPFAKKRIPWRTVTVFQKNIVLFSYRFRLYIRVHQFN